MNALSGHAQLLNAQRPLEEVLADPSVPTQTRSRLKSLQAARGFASRELALPDNDSYRSYADLGRPYAVWNVVATPAYSLKPKQWCFIFVGCISYRGYYRREQAETYADRLRTQGLDVQVVGARAYSTLGWSDDPLLNTMLYRSEARRVGIVFHELAHQQLFIKGDSTFNESFAGMVEQEGVRRWFLAQGKSAPYQAYMQEHKRDVRFKQMLLQTREKLQRLYRQKTDRSAAYMREEKKRIFSELKLTYAEMKKNQPAFSVYEDWMAQDLNNAHLALVATYYEDVPALMHLLQSKQGDLRAFYRAAADLAHKDPQKRRILLQQWAKNNP
ncbi:PUTATIVE ZINC PROTEASE PROTEIN [hydrothermal vent metagenome]|uniref:PUTATIVE ZINC PROTEASE PROTEIN n=1 Tax=hydrothermal vent metagenome TaxID=652676 RepID=A0A3B1BRH4_9ZZZZ